MLNIIVDNTAYWKCVCGTENAVTASHDGLKWKTAQEIQLPPCERCGAITTIRVHDEEETPPPKIAIDQNTGKILQVAPGDHPKYSDNLWQRRSEIVRHPLPHPTLAHLSEGQIKELQAYARSKAPDVPVDWMLTETTREVIHEVKPHPAVALHRQLADLMRQNGKVYTEPVTPPN